MYTLVIIFCSCITLSQEISCLLILSSTLCYMPHPPKITGYISHTSALKKCIFFAIFILRDEQPNVFGDVGGPSLTSCISHCAIYHIIITLPSMLQWLKLLPLLPPPTTANTTKMMAMWIGVIVVAVVTALARGGGGGRGVVVSLFCPPALQICLAAVEAVHCNGRSQSCWHTDATAAIVHQQFDTCCLRQGWCD